MHAQNNHTPAINSCLVSQAGFTLLELIVVVGIMSIAMGIAVLNLKDFNNGSRNAANEIAALIKNTRFYAMSSTTTVRLAPISSTRIAATAAQTCAATTRSSIPELSMTLTDGSSLSATNWSVCYTSRGISQESLDITVSDHNLSKTIQVVLGGGVRVL